MSGNLCFSAIEEAVRRYGIPKVVHTDRGKSVYEQEIFGVFRGIGSKEQFWGERF